jgi:hypothetical protein
LFACCTNKVHAETGTVRMVRAVGLAVSVVFVCFAPAYAGGAEALPHYDCSAPIKQREFATKVQLDRYKAEVDLFRSCIEAFVKEQEDAIEAHRHAAQGAIDDWNKFSGPQTNPPPKPESPGGGSGFRGKP